MIYYSLTVAGKVCLEKETKSKNGTFFIKIM
jgi:hypothetical protein